MTTFRSPVTRVTEGRYRLDGKKAGKKAKQWAITLTALSGTDMLVVRAKGERASYATPVEWVIQNMVARRALYRVSSNDRKQFQDADGKFDPRTMALAASHVGGAR